MPWWRTRESRSAWSLPISARTRTYLRTRAISLPFVRESKEVARILALVEFLTRSDLGDEGDPDGGEWPG